MIDIKIALPQGGDFRERALNGLSGGTISGIIEIQDEPPIASINSKGAEGGLLDVLKFTLEHADAISVLVNLAITVLQASGATKILVKFFNGDQEIGNLESAFGAKLAQSKLPAETTLVVVMPKAEPVE